jgi:DnaJ-class molecular chaperone
MSYEEFMRKFGGKNQQGRGQKTSSSFNFDDIFGNLFGGKKKEDEGADSDEPQPTDDPFFKRKGNDAYVEVTINLAQALLGSRIRVRTPSGKRVTLKIPPGIDPERQLRIPSMGYAEQKELGDLYIRVKVKPHPVFRREESNLLMDLHIKLSTAILGAEQTIKTLDGDISIKIPEGVRHGEVLRVRGKGIPSERGKRGDLLVTVVVEMPKKLSRTARTLIDELKKEGM